jgi:hypothetical protein
MMQLILIVLTKQQQQSFYSQASWGRLEMKPHEPKPNQKNKSEKEGENKWR